MLPHDIKEKRPHYAINYPVMGEMLARAPDASRNPIRQQGPASKKSPQNSGPSVVCCVLGQDNAPDQMHNQLPGETCYLLPPLGKVTST